MVLLNLTSAVTSSTYIFEPLYLQVMIVSRRDVAKEGEVLSEKNFSFHFSDVTLLDAVAGRIRQLRQFQRWIWGQIRRAFYKWDGEKNNKISRHSIFCDTFLPQFWPPPLCDKMYNLVLLKVLESMLQKAVISLVTSPKAVVLNHGVATYLCVASFFQFVAK